MKRFPILAITVVLVVLCGLQSDAFGQKKHKKKKLGANACKKSIAACPLEGCGTDFDPLLNRSKNRSDPPADADVVDMSLTDMKALSQTLPDGWKEGDARASFSGTGKEGQAIRVMGYLWASKREGAESCNCSLDANGIPGQLMTDIHMVVTAAKNSKETTSVTAEITPRVRALRPDPNTWHWSSIHTKDKKFVRVTGWLMLDTHHLVSAPLKRKTNWEIHPVTKFEVCISTITKCRAGQGWAEIE